MKVSYDESLVPQKSSDHAVEFDESVDDDFIFLDTKNRFVQNKVGENFYRAHDLHLKMFTNLCQQNIFLNA